MPPIASRLLRLSLAVALLAAALVALSLMTGLFSTAETPVGHWDAVAAGKAHLEQGRPDLAFQAVAHIRDDQPGAGEALAVAGKALLTYRQIPFARRTLERALKLQPNQPEAAKLLAAVYLASGDGIAGVAMLKQAARLDPTDFRPWLAIGKAQLDLGEFGEAATAFAEALSRAPPEPEATDARLGRLRALLQTQAFDRAGAEIEPLLRARPDDPELLALASRHAQALGRTEAALDLADRALRLAPENFDALLVRARLHNAAGRLDPALDDLRRAVELNPNVPAALTLKVQVEARLGLDEQSAATAAQLAALNARLTLMDDLTRQINARPDDPEPRYQMGRAALEGKMSTLAYQCFQAALDVDPTYQPAADELRRLGEQPTESPDPGPASP